MLMGSSILTKNMMPGKAHRGDELTCCLELWPVGHCWLHQLGNSSLNNACEHLEHAEHGTIKKSQSEASHVMHDIRKAAGMHSDGTSSSACDEQEHEMPFS